MSGGTGIAVYMKISCCFDVFQLKLFKNLLCSRSCRLLKAKFQNNFTKVRTRDFFRLFLGRCCVCFVERTAKKCNKTFIPR